MKANKFFLITMMSIFGMISKVSSQTGTFTGVGAGFNNIGLNNSAFGMNALYSNTYGVQNCAFGTKALEKNIIGDNNVAIGHRALGDSNTSGNNNTAVGYASLSTSTGNGNIALGYFTPRNLTSGSGNIFIGNATAQNLVNGNANVIIGNNISLLNNTDNAIVFGDGAGNQRIYVNGGNGYSGIGLGNNIIPQNRLELSGGIAGTSGLRFRNYTSASNVVANPSNPPKVLSVNANGDVILVNDAIGTGSGGSTIITAGTNINVSPYNATTGYTISSPYQTLSQSGNIVTLTNGGSFTLPNFTDTDTDDQTLSITDNVLSISEGNSVTLPTTSVIAGTNVVVTGTGTTADPFVINATATGTGGCNIYNCDGTIDTTTAGSPNLGLRTVTMGNNNLFFQTNTANDGNGRIYIGSTIANNGSSAGFPAITATSQFRLLVEGGILSERVKVALRSTNNWADYVFANDYKLMLLKDLETYIAENKHLPGIESAETLSREGLDLGDMQAKQMAKIEELTLYLIEQNKQIEKQNKDIEELKALVKTLLDRK